LQFGLGLGAGVFEYTFDALIVVVVGGGAVGKDGKSGHGGGAVGVLPVATVFGQSQWHSQGWGFGHEMPAFVTRCHVCNATK